MADNSESLAGEILDEIYFYVESSRKSEDHYHAEEYGRYSMEQSKVDRARNVAIDKILALIDARFCELLAKKTRCIIQVDPGTGEATVDYSIEKESK